MLVGDAIATGRVSGRVVGVFQLLILRGPFFEPYGYIYTMYSLYALCDKYNIGVLCLL